MNIEKNMYSGNYGMILNLIHLVHNARISSVELASSDITNLSTAENKS